MSRVAAIHDTLPSSPEEIGLSGLSPRHRWSQGHCECPCVWVSFGWLCSALLISNAHSTGASGLFLNTSTVPSPVSYTVKLCFSFGGTGIGSLSNNLINFLAPTISVRRRAALSSRQYPKIEYGRPQDVDGALEHSTCCPASAESVNLIFSGPTFTVERVTRASWIPCNPLLLCNLAVVI